MIKCFYISRFSWENKNYVVVIYLTYEKVQHGSMNLKLIHSFIIKVHALIFSIGNKLKIFFIMPQKLEIKLDINLDIQTRHKLFKVIIMMLFFGKNSQRGRKV